MHSIKVNSLSKNYKENKALKDVSFEVKGGEIIGVIGKNGAGKTTLFNLIAGNNMASSGEIVFDGEVLKVDSKVRKDFGVLIKPVFYDYMKAYEFLNLLDTLNSKRHSKEEIEEILEMVGLGEAKNKLIKSFSFGMKQRLMFANTLLGANKCMILDEPFVGLDINGRDIVKNHIREISREKGIPILFSDHNLDEVMDLCTRVILLSEGEKVYDGELETFKQDITVTVEDTNKINGESFNIIDKKRVLVKKESLDEGLRKILANVKIENIESVNILNDLLNGGGKK